MNLKIGDQFIATDRLGRTSTWKLIDIKRDIHYLLEATGETLKRFEKNYYSVLNMKDKTNNDVINKRRGKKDFCIIEVGPAWFQYREIEIIEEPL